MKNLIVMSLGLAVLSCGTALTNKSNGSADPAILSETQTICPAGSTTCTPGTAVSTTTMIGDAPTPISYTFTDTPDANICVDAFNRGGIALPAATTARTLDANSLRANGIVMSDVGISTAPVMNVVHLDSFQSNVVIQLLNKTGFYCIVYDNAQFSNVSIQTACTAVVTTVEPTITNTVNSPAHAQQSCGFWGHLWGHCAQQIAQGGTTNSTVSNINMLPCI